MAFWIFLSRNVSLVTLSIFMAVALTVIGATGGAVFALDILWPDSFPPPSGSLPADLLLSAAAIAALVVGTHPWAITVTAPAPTPP